jgi:hypothetical protein
VQPGDATTAILNVAALKSEAVVSRDGVAERLGGLEIEKEYVRRNLTNPAVLIWHRVPLDRHMKARNVELGLHVTIVSVLTVKRLIFAAAICAAFFGGASAPSSAADLGPVLMPGAKHVMTPWRYWSWRDRCSWAGYYCLYAWHGYVYHYPWDDRANAYAHYTRRHRH